MGWLRRWEASFERGLHAGRLCVGLYRLTQRMRRWGVPFVPHVLHMLNGVLFGAEIHPGATIGPGLQVAHPRGVVVGRHVRAGRNLKLYSGVVLGVKVTQAGRMPTLGDDVTVYAGAKVLGDVTIGDGAVIGANAVVLADVPAGAFAVGVPARITPAGPKLRMCASGT